MAKSSTQPYYTRDEVEALLLERRARWMEEVDQLIGLALAPIREELAEAVKFGDAIALKAAAGQVICAEQGGPATEREPFTLTSRASIGPWESWECLRGA